MKKIIIQVCWIFPKLIIPVKLIDENYARIKLKTCGLAKKENSNTYPEILLTLWFQMTSNLPV